MEVEQPTAAPPPPPVDSRTAAQRDAEERDALAERIRARDDAKTKKVALSKEEERIAEETRRRQELAQQERNVVVPRLREASRQSMYDIVYIHE